jgi:hypothetical protein
MLVALRAVSETVTRTGHEIGPVVEIQLRTVFIKQLLRV